MEIYQDRKKRQMLFVKSLFFAILLLAISFFILSILLGWVDLQNSPNKLVKNRNFILIIPFLFFAGVAVIALFASREHFAYLKRREPTLTLSSTGLTVFQNKMGELFFPWKEIDEVKFRQLGRTEILQVKVKENVRTINLPIQTLMIDRQVLQEELQKYI